MPAIDYYKHLDKDTPVRRLDQSRIDMHKAAESWCY
jgi:hypothetical protein